MGGGGGVGLGGQDDPPAPHTHPFWGTPKLQKEGNTSRMCAQMQHVLIVKVRR